MGLPAVPRVPPVVPAFAAALALHVGVLAFLVSGGAAPGLPEGIRSPVVEVVSQEKAAEMTGSSVEPPRPLAEDGSPPASPDDAPVDRSPKPMTFDVVLYETAPDPLPQVVSSPASETVVPSGSERIADGPPQKPVAPPPEPGKPPKAQAKATEAGRKSSRRSERTRKPGERRQASKAVVEDASAETAATPANARRVASLGAGGAEARVFPAAMRDSLVGLLQRQVERCYVPPADASRGVILPVIGLRLERNGTLVAQPRVVRSGRSGPDASLAQAALKAVRLCAPYAIPARFAPYYDEWKDIAAEFEFRG